MAERRMISKKIFDSDAFLDMPLSAQALYFHLIGRADDDGFLNNAKTVMRLVRADQANYDLLIEKRFILVFSSGICVIKHWRIHNYVRGDRYKPTAYSEEKSQLYVKKNGSYTLDKEKGVPIATQKDTNGIPKNNQRDTQVRLDKDSLVKDSIDKDNKNINMSEKSDVSDDDAKTISKKELSEEEKLQAASEENFNIIYAIYPKKVGRAKALEHYYQWRKGRLLDKKKRVKLSNDQIYLAVQNYVEQQKATGKDIEYWKNFDTLMNKSLLDYLVEEQNE